MLRGDGDLRLCATFYYPMGHFLQDFLRIIDGNGDGMLLCWRWFTFIIAELQ